MKNQSTFKHNQFKLWQCEEVRRNKHFLSLAWKLSRHTKSWCKFFLSMNLAWRFQRRLSSSQLSSHDSLKCFKCSYLVTRERGPFFLWPKETLRQNTWRYRLPGSDSVTCSGRCEQRSSAFSWPLRGLWYRGFDDEDPQLWLTEWSPNLRGRLLRTASPFVWRH